MTTGPRRESTTPTPTAATQNPLPPLSVSQREEISCAVCGGDLVDSFAPSPDGRCDCCRAYRPAPPQPITREAEHCSASFCRLLAAVRGFFAMEGLRHAY